MLSSSSQFKITMPSGYNWRRVNLSVIIIFTLFTIIAFQLAYINKDMARVKSSDYASLNLQQQQATKPDVQRSDGAVSGKLFTGLPFRQFRAALLFQNNWRNSRMSEQQFIAEKQPVCSNWAVTTTVFNLTAAVWRQINTQLWCTVIVLDLKGPLDYVLNAPRDFRNGAVVVLTPEDQRLMDYKFVKLTPWNSFARKNIGYLYAIAHGARNIWDFDDDNLLKFWVPHASPESFPPLLIKADNQGKIPVQEVRNYTHLVLNPLNFLGFPIPNAWPRGFPLSKIQNNETFNFTSNVFETHFDIGKIAVFQSVADKAPDLDAISRLTVSSKPIWFQRSSETAPLVIPSNVFIPYNAQAVLHQYCSFFTLIMPTTVHGRVADIWRSYFSQALYTKLKLHVAYYSRPLVVQNRHVHNYLADFAAEDDLYKKAYELVTFLRNWTAPHENDIVGNMEMLWVHLYERGYIEIEDVYLVQEWLKTLIKLGYKFPTTNQEKATENSASNTVYKFQKILADYAKATFAVETETKSSCAHIPQLQFWTRDLHDEPRVDVTSLLQNMGHKVIVGACMNQSSKCRFILKKSSGIIYTNLSSAVKNANLFAQRPLNEDILAHFEHYKDNNWIKQTDAFICNFPTAFCQYWMPFNKSIIFDPVHRNNIWKCWREQWDELDEDIHNLNKSAKPKHFIAAGSLYDANYLQHYTGIEPLQLFSYSGYNASAEYRPTKSEILFFSYVPLNELENSAKLTESFEVVSPLSLYRTYKFENLMKHRAAIYIPRSVMSYNLTELYAMGLPLFMPSMKFFQTHAFGEDRSVQFGLLPTNFCE